MSEDSSQDATAAPAGRRSILTNSVWMVGGRLLVAAIQWATTLLIIRTLSVDEFGQFSLIFSILGMLSIITDMGLGRVALEMHGHCGGFPFFTGVDGVAHNIQHGAMHEVGVEFEFG